EDPDEAHEDHVRDGDSLRVRDRDPPTRSLTELALGLGDAGRTLVADRGSDHALGADRAVASGAVDAGLHAGVAVTGLERCRRWRRHDGVFVHGDHATAVLRFRT